MTRARQPSNSDYPEIDWPVSEVEASKWKLLRSERKDGFIRFLWETSRGPAWTPPVKMSES